MISLNFKVHIDDPSVTKLLNSLSQEQRDRLSADDIMWKVGETYSQNNETYMPIYAIGIKPKNQFSDAEYQQVLKQSPLTHLSDLYAEQFRTDCLHCPILEIQSAPTPDGTPLLHKG